MSNQPPSGLPPPLIVSSRDLARLEALLDSPVLSRHPAAIALMDELNRAEVRAPEDIPSDVVTMHSRVECEDIASGEEHVLTLVYPNEADVERHRVSVLAPVGSALLGLSVGQAIAWPVPGGKTIQVRVLGISYQPERDRDVAP